MNRTGKRSAIITPIKYNEPRYEAKCQICSLSGRDNWASSICVLCNLFICKQHMKIIREKSYCYNCRENESSKQILIALETDIGKRKKWCCF
jgi:hypothetical protein